MTFERTHASAVATHSQLHIHIKAAQQLHTIFAAYALPAIMAASLEAKAETDERPEDTKATSKQPLEAAQSLGPATPARAPVLGQILSKPAMLGADPSSKWGEFVDELKANFPPRPDLTYLSGTSLSQSPMTLSLWQLGWGLSCTSKPATFKITARRLVDEYLCNSFLTEAEPLLLYQGPEPGAAVDANDQPVFFTHYVKGAARATSVLFLAHVLVHHLKADVASLSPQLHQSMTVISATRSVATDAASIAIENAKLSARGDIRKGHDTITWLSKLSLLKQLSPTEVLRRWNEAATRKSALPGQKRTAILQLLELPQESVLLLLEHSSNFGEDTAFAHDAFANKRLSPGFSPPQHRKALAEAPHSQVQLVRPARARDANAQNQADAQKMGEGCPGRGHEHGTAVGELRSRDAASAASSKRLAARESHAAFSRGDHRPRA